MPTEFTMPKLGLTMEEGTIIEWLVPDGTDVAEGSRRAAIETDKVETEVKVMGSAVVASTCGRRDTLACGAVIGVVARRPARPHRQRGRSGADGDRRRACRRRSAVSRRAALAAASTVDPPPRRPASTAAGVVRLAQRPASRRRAGVDRRHARGTGPGGRIVSEDVKTVDGHLAPSDLGTSPSRTIAAPGRSPPATSRPATSADLLGVDISSVPAIRIDGRITREDVARSRPLAARRRATVPRAGAAVSPTRRCCKSRPGHADVAGCAARSPSGCTSRCARWPSSTLTMDADLDAVVADRAAPQGAGAAPGYTDYVIAAAAQALRDHPHVNAQITPDGSRLPARRPRRHGRRPRRPAGRCRWSATPIGSPWRTWLAETTGSPRRRGPAS